MDTQIRALIDDILIEIRELGIEVSALVLFVFSFRWNCNGWE